MSPLPPIYPHSPAPSPPPTLRGGLFMAGAVFYTLLAMVVWLVNISMLCERGYAQPPQDYYPREFAGDGLKILLRSLLLMVPVMTDNRTTTLERFFNDKILWLKALAGYDKVDDAILAPLRSHRALMAKYVNLLPLPQAELSHRQCIRHTENLLTTHRDIVDDEASEIYQLSQKLSQLQQGIELLTSRVELLNQNVQAHQEKVNGVYQNLMGFNRVFPDEPSSYFVTMSREMTDEGIRAYMQNQLDAYKQNLQIVIDDVTTRENYQQQLDELKVGYMQLKAALVQLTQQKQSLLADDDAQEQQYLLANIAEHSGSPIYGGRSTVNNQHQITIINDDEEETSPPTLSSLRQ